ncbi:MAG: restriction endonuclease subunit S [Terracidiphilus sp.]|jgi:type I restriction enzyme S subunit
MPSDWELGRLGDLTSKPDYGLTASATTERGGPQFLRITDIQDGTVLWPTVPYCAAGAPDSDRYRLRAGDLVVARIGATTGKAYLVENPPAAVFASYLIRIRTGPRLLPEFLDQFTKSQAYREQIDAGKGGRLKQGVSIPVLQDLRVPLPPISEQRGIANVLRTVQHAKEATEKVIVATKQLKQSLLTHLYTSGPTGMRQAGGQESRESELGPIPAHWKTAALGDAVVATQYGLSQRGEESGQYAILRMTNLVEGKLDTTALQYVDLPKAVYEKFSLKKGDLLFNRTNSHELVGKTSLFDLDGQFVFASYLIRVSTDRAVLDPEFVNYFLNLDRTQSGLRQMAMRAVSQSNINANKLRSVRVPVPPIQEQQRTAAMLSFVDRKLQAERRQSQLLAVLSQRLLHHLMTGKVRVHDLPLPEPPGSH